MDRSNKLRAWLFPAILILFILQVMLLPVVVGFTYAVPAERPEHTLTYKTGALVWDAATSVRPDGSAELSFFETPHSNVSADNAESILAPGTGKDSIIRLKNDARQTITYTAILYSLSTSPLLDIGSQLSGEGFSDTSDYTLPGSVKPGSVIRAVSGKLDGKKMQDFTINWFWNYEDASDVSERDRLDTYLGSKAAGGDADEVTLGFYLLVSDTGGGSSGSDDKDGSDGGNEPIRPSVRTGDDSMIEGYVVLMLISGGLCIFLAVRRRKEQRG